MITQAQSKGIQSAADAKTLRKNYDTDNDGNIDDAKSLVSDEQRADAQAKKTQAMQEKQELLGQDSFTVQDNENMQNLNKQIEDADAIINNHDKMTLAQQASTISQQKLDSQLGQALGIDQNRNAGVNYAQNAMYGEMSQQQSTQAKLDAQGGVEGAVHTDVTDAQIKAKTQAEVLDAQLKEGGAKDGLLTKSADDLSKAADKLAQTAGTLAGGKTAADMKTIDEHGGSDKYIKAQERTAVEKATHSALASEFADNKEAKNRQIAEERAQYKAAGKEEEYLKDGKKYGFLDSNGNATDDAEAWVRGRATMTAAAMSKHEQGFIGGSRMNTVTNPLTGESITNVDGVRRIEEGTSTNAHLGDSGNIESQKTREAYDYAMNPMSKGLPMLIGKTHEQAAEYFKSFDMDDEDANTMASIVTGGGAAVTAAGILEAGTRIKNSVMGNRVATQTFSYDTGNVNGEGEPIMKEVKKGEHFSTKSNSTLADYVKNNDVSKVERGIPGKLMDKVWEGTKSSSPQNSMPDNSDNISTNTQNQSTNSSGNNEANDKVQHNNNSSSKDTNSIPNDAEKVKSPSIAEQIDAQYKTDKKIAGIDSQIEAKKELFAKQNALNGGGTPEQLARQKMELDAMQGARDKLAQPDFSAPKERGFFGKRVDAVKGALSHSRGGILKTIGLTASAAVLGQANETFANTLSALDPASLIMGSDMSKMADLSYAMKNGAVENSGGSVPSWTSNIKMASPSPQHIQNAFSTPSGFNTQQAMGGKTAFNDNTSNVNSTPQEYQANVQQSQADRMDDMTLNTEYGAEAASETRDAIEKLTETIYANR